VQRLCKFHPTISLNFPPNPRFISPLPYGISHLGSLSGGTAHATNALLAGGGAGRLSLRFPANGRVSSARRQRPVDQTARQHGLCGRNAARPQPAGHQNLALRQRLQTHRSRCRPKRRRTRRPLAAEKHRKQPDKRYRSPNQTRSRTPLAEQYQRQAARHPAGQTRANVAQCAHRLHPLSGRQRPANPGIPRRLVEQTGVSGSHRRDGAGSAGFHPAIRPPHQYGSAPVCRHLLGTAVFFAGQFFGFTTRLYGVPAFVSATLPTLAFALWAVYLIRKQERRQDLGFKPSNNAKSSLKNFQAAFLG